VRHCYDDVVHPQDIRACSNCHDASDPATPDAANWYALPTGEACGSCHDDVDFASGDNHADGIAADNTECASCHASDAASPIEVRQAHRMLARERAARYRFDLLGVTTPGAGAAPAATFAISDPLDDDRRYDLSSDADLAASRLRLSISWPTRDYSNAGNGQSNSQPEASSIYVNGLLAARANGDLSYDLDLGTVPADVTGSGVVVMEGAVASDLGNLGVQNAHRYFAITDAATSPAPRRVSVEMSRCNDCHDSLSFHGGRNTDSIEACQSCHNANAARGGSPSRGPMDMKHFLHRLHALDPIRYPRPVSDCQACHTAGGLYPADTESAVLPTSTDRGADPLDPFDNGRVTANASTCGVCHDGPDARVHMVQNGASFDACLGPDGTVYARVDVCGAGGSLGEVLNESCAVCHGPGRIADAAAMHGL
jgi:OmcA/MtrC family decaheme c-type cytochrome